MSFQWHFSAKFQSGKEKGVKKKQAKIKTALLAKTYLTIIREKCALDVTKNYIERLVLFLLKPEFNYHLIYQSSSII